MAITRLQLEHFTAFESLDMELSPGINVLVGANGTGKTHIMKVCYAACETSNIGSTVGMEFYEKLTQVFLPTGRILERLVKRGEKSRFYQAKVGIYFKDRPPIRVEFSDGGLAGPTIDSAFPIECSYIPVKEMLANAPGFRSLYALREIHFEEVYKDILDRAYLPPLRYPSNSHLLDTLRETIGGEVVIEGEEFFVHTEHGLLEFTLLAEGFRKLALLWLLIRNGSLQKGSVLFWDEPETNLNPKLIGTVIERPHGIAARRRPDIPRHP